MCSIMTFKKSMYNHKLSTHIVSDMVANPDGFSVILVDEFGAVVADLHTMDSYAVLGLLEYCEYTRAFVHCRLSTQGQVTVRNTHGFYNSGIYYQHNGILSDPVAQRFEVDSMLIGAKLDQFGLHRTLDWLKSQSYANCFFVDTNTNRYFVTRNTVGTLYTDGKGNYSTSQFESICVPVVNNSEHTYSLMDFEYIRSSKPSAPIVTQPIDDIDDEFDIDDDERESMYLDERNDVYDFRNFQDIMDAEDEAYTRSRRKAK